jgi:hypothetical protein
MEDLNREISIAKLCSEPISFSKSLFGRRDIYYECVNGIQVRRSDEDIHYWENRKKSFIAHQASSSPLSGEIEDNNADSE